MSHQIINKRICFSSENKTSLSESVEYVERVLKQEGLPRRLVMKTVLTTEESVALLMEKAGPKAALRVQIKKLFGDIRIILSMEGDQVDPMEQSADSIDVSAVDEDIEAQRAIRAILLKAQGESIKYAYSHGENRIQIRVGESDQSMLYLTVSALIFGLIFGFIASFAMPESVSTGLSDYVFTPVSTLFMNALKMVIAPVVFFSIVSCLSQFKDLSELGRIGAKVMGMYLLTTVIAVTIGTVTSLVISPGEWGFAQKGGVEMAQVSVDTSVDTSIYSMIMDIVPDNIVAPFLESDTLQLIFLAVICGVAVSMIGEYSKILSDFFEACNSLFLTITTMIAKFIPLAVFCSVSKMIMSIGGSSVLNMVSLMLTQTFAVFCMLVAYGLLILMLGRLNPIVFFKKNREGMLTSFTLSSSSAAMPTNMRTCTDKLGISSKVCSFSIPLGATINMDGTCIFLSVLSLFLAKANGIAVTPSQFIVLAVTIILLSLGCPGVPGAALICLGVALGSIGVPVETMGIVMGVVPILDMFDTMSNTTGDVACALIVSKSEGLLDEKKYYS